MIAPIMPKLSLEITEKLSDACKAGAGDAGARLSAALDSTMQIADVSDGQSLAVADLPQELSDAGLVITFQFGDQAIALLLPAETNLLPSWYAEPNAEDNARLQSLAEDLSKLLLPEEFTADKTWVRPVADLAASAQAAKLADPAGCVELTITGEHGGGTCYLFWPLAQPAALLSSDKPVPGAKSTAVGAASPTVSDKLPKYSRSLLSVRVPVIVNLAETKMNVHDVIHLGPGAVIQFDKSCEAMLDLEAGGHKIATGEAVKVGDKFGLRITSIRLPEERYQSIAEK